MESVDLGPAGCNEREGMGATRLVEQGKKKMEISSK